MTPASMYPSTREQRMLCISRSGAYHSCRPSRWVFHSHADCVDGRRIAQANLTCGRHSGLEPCRKCSDKDEGTHGGGGPSRSSVLVRGLAGGRERVSGGREGAAGGGSGGASMHGRRRAKLLAREVGVIQDRGFSRLSKRRALAVAVLMLVAGGQCADSALQTAEAALRTVAPVQFEAFRAAENALREAEVTLRLTAPTRYAAWNASRKELSEADAMLGETSTVLQRAETALRAAAPTEFEALARMTAVMEGRREIARQRQRPPSRRTMLARFVEWARAADSALQAAAPVQFAARKKALAGRFENGPSAIREAEVAIRTAAPARFRAWGAVWDAAEAAGEAADDWSARAWDKVWQAWKSAEPTLNAALLEAEAALMPTAPTQFEALNAATKAQTTAIQAEDAALRAVERTAAALRAAAPAHFEGLEAAGIAVWEAEVALRDAARAQFGAWKELRARAR